MHKYNTKALPTGCFYIISRSVAHVRVIIRNMAVHLTLWLNVT